MTGPIALHGGGEFHAGDEPFLEALIGSVADGRVLRIAVVPVAAARHRPEIAAQHGVEAFGRVAEAAGVQASAEAVLVVDAASASDPGLARRLRHASIVYLPGGDPDLVPGVMAGSRAWSAVLEAHTGGAAVGGASAGAMGLAERTWTPGGWVVGLGLVRGLVVVPHAERFDPRGRESEIERLGRDGVGRLGLDERTGVIRESDGRWVVAGAGRTLWWPAVGDAVVARHGERLRLPG